MATSHEAATPSAANRNDLYNLPVARLTLTVVAVLIVLPSLFAIDTQSVGLTMYGQTIRAGIIRASSASAPVVALIGGLGGRDAFRTEIAGLS